MNNLETDYDTDFERLIIKYAGMGHSSLYNLEYETKSYFIECFHKHRKYFGLKAIIGSREFIENEIDQYLIEEFHEQFSLDKKYSYDEYRNEQYILEKDDEEILDNRQRANDMNETLKPSIWEC